MTDIQDLSQQLNSKQITVRYNAAITLAKLGRKEGVPTLINAVEQRHWEHCNLYEVVDLLAELQESKAVDALIELLDVTGHIVGNALSALLVIDDKRGVDAVFKMMGHSSPWFGWGTAQLIASYEGRYLERLIGHVNDPQPLFRSRVIYALGQIAQSVEDKRVNDALINALDDKNADVRQRSASAIGRAKIASAQSKLTNLLTDSATEVKQSAAESLYMLGDTSDQVLNVLFITLYDKNWLIRRNAVWALQRIEDTRAVEPLIKVLKTDTQRGIRSYAATALGHLKDDRALPSLFEALKDTDEVVRVAVVKALAEVGTRDVLSRLSEALFDNHPAVQQAINEVWEKYKYE